MTVRIGRVSIVGAGPGDPGLLTVKGRRLLRAADAVVHDRLVAPEIVALARTAERYDVGKSPGNGRSGDSPRGTQQAAIDTLLVRLAREGKRVVRLKGGDPFVFGRTGSELDALVAAGVPFEIVPGVTSAIAAPAYAGVPVTDRRHSSGMVVVTATRGADSSGALDWSAVARIPTVVVLMGGARAEEVTAALLRHGVPAERPAVAVERATTARQRVVRSTLGALASDMAAAAIGSPVTIVVGEVASLSDRYRWTPFRVPPGESTEITPSPSARAALRRRAARPPLPSAPARSRSRGTTRGRPEMAPRVVR